MHTQTLIIGSGPGGYVAAIRAAQLGQKVTVIEREKIGGVCSNVGCIPSKALISVGHRYHEIKSAEQFGIHLNDVQVDFHQVQKFKQNVVNKLTRGVELLLSNHQIKVIYGEATFLSDHAVIVNNQEIPFDNAIIATGSRPIEIPSMPFSKRIIDSTGALSLIQVPTHLVVIGGGYIGTELGMAYANLGAKVTILEGGSDILAGFDSSMTHFVKKEMKKRQMQLVTNAFAQGVVEENDCIQITYLENGALKNIVADYVLVTVGRKPNTDLLALENTSIEFANGGLIKVNRQGQTTARHIYAIGDIVAGPQLAHKASFEGKVAAEAIAGKHVQVDYTCIPAVCFTTPELATVGMTKQMADKEGLQTKISKMSYGSNGRALANGTQEGFVQLVIRENDGLILGAQVVGANASNLIAELSLAIEGSLTAEDVALTIHPHPTYGEIIMEVAQNGAGLPIHMLKSN